MTQRLIEGGVFTNLKLNGMVNSFPPFITSNAQNKGKIVRLNIQNKGKPSHCMQTHIMIQVRV